MPQEPTRSLEEIARDCGRYPVDAYLFVQAAVAFTVDRVHGESGADASGSRHIRGQQLCAGARDLALRRWGRLASVVLRSWNVEATMDLGVLVFSLVEAGYLARTEQDTIDDFRDVFDLHRELDVRYRIEVKDGP